MTELQQLPPDQRAVLSLVLDRGKSYAEVASMLAIPEATVRERAHAALDALARSESANGLAAADRATGPAADGRSSTAPSPVSAVDAAAPPRAPATPRAPAAPRATTPARAGDRPAARTASGSRLGGAVLLVGLLVAVIVAVVLLAGGGKGGGKAATAGSGSGASATSTSTSSGAKPRIDNKLALSPVQPESQAGGEAYVLSDGSRRAFYVAARGLAPSHGFFYAVWLYNSPSSSAPLGRAPTVGSNGRLEGGGPLPNNAADYAKLIVTRETNTRAHRPGAIVLSGRFSLH